MSGSGYVEWVERAASGDLDAFARLVEAFQNAVTAAAFGWLGDFERARDVSQEAFLDAYAHLPELRDPAAFPGWLRRIVHKHCDRVTRRRAADTGGLESDSTANGETLEDQATRAEQASGLRQAVSRLPPPLRIVVALTYLAELSGTQSAEFLGVPLSTIKKRLRSARSVLREQGEDFMQESPHELLPSASRDFTELVSFFLAIRQGDHARIRALIGHNPALVNAVQEWEPELVVKGVLPFASRATALITAIERDDLTLLGLLLDAGADVDGRCACATSESPIWAATLLNRTRHLESLLERGADPNRASVAGSRPLHVAAMRGHRASIEVLLSHGADRHALDGQGLTPADWASRNGHDALAQRLASEAPHVVPQRHPLRMPQSEGRPDSVLFTGIKALDLFCPLPRGALVRVPFMAGAGMVVLMGELCERIVRSPSGRALWTGFAQRPFDLADWRTEMAELGIAGRVEHSLADLDASADARRDAFWRGLDEAVHLREGGCHVLCVVLCDSGFEADVEAAVPRLLETGSPGSITTLLITPFPEQASATWDEPAPPYGAQLRLDRTMARRGLFPAVHSALSWSRALDDEVVGTEHVNAARAAQELLAAHVKHDPDLSAVEKATVVDPHFTGQERAVDATGDHGSAVALLSYLSQPFYVAEPFTGRPGSWVEHKVLIDDVRNVLSGCAVTQTNRRR